MKRFIALTTVSMLAFAGAATAMTSPSAIDLNEVRSSANGADISGLTDAQIAQIVAQLHSTDSESDKQSFVRSVLAAK